MKRLTVLACFICSFLFVKAGHTVTDSKGGLLTVHIDGGKYLAELPDSLLDRDLLVISRIERTSSGVANVGDEINETVIRFSTTHDNKIGIRKMAFKKLPYEPDSNGLWKALTNSDLPAFSYIFENGKRLGDSITISIDVTNLLGSDNDLLFFSTSAKNITGGGSFQPDKSYIEDIRSYPSHVVFRTLKSYATPNGNFAFEINTTLLLLPKLPMKRRAYDPRVGYISLDFTDFESNPQHRERVSIVTRWRLEPKEEDKERYLRGDLVDPEKPIIFYIDPATPKKWIPYLIEGIDDWQQAFEQAGFKNAIRAEEAPENKVDWDIEDGDHNALIYKAGGDVEIQNAFGTNICDPRSGEILIAHIDWFHDVQSLFHNWYFAQAAGIYPPARKMIFDDTLMGKIFRIIACHETGHTLGLLHNMGASSTVPVDSLRNKHWVEKYGFCPSIMDYARFNYVAQAEDGIAESGLFPRIGEYDKWAIEWAYRWWPDERSEIQRLKLDEWVTNHLKSNKRLWYGPEQADDDPRCQSEDVGDDAIKASGYGIKYLQKVLLNLEQWTSEKEKGYYNLKDKYQLIFNYFTIYLDHVCKNIGGIITMPKTSEQPGLIYQYVSKARQQQSMQFLRQYLFESPRWIISNKMFELTGVTAISMLSKAQDDILTKLINPALFDKLLQSEAYDFRSAYTLMDMLNDLRQGIWGELSTHQSIDICRRNLQKMYIDYFLTIINASPLPKKGPGIKFVGTVGISTTSDAMSIVKAQLRSLHSDISRAIPHMNDKESLVHLQDLKQRIEESLENIQ